MPAHPKLAPMLTALAAHRIALPPRARATAPEPRRTNRDHRTRDDRQGHLPTLIACFLHFDLSFMLWVLLGALGILIAEDLQLSAAQKGCWSRCRSSAARCCGFRSGS